MHGPMLEVFALIILLMLLRSDPTYYRGRVANLDAQFELASRVAGPASPAAPDILPALCIPGQASIPNAPNCRTRVLVYWPTRSSRSMPHPEMTLDGRPRPATGGRT